MTTESEAGFGARHLIQDCMGLKKGQTLLVFLDETTIEVGRLLLEAADTLGVQASSFFIPSNSQRRIPHEKDLSLVMLGAIKDVRGVISCLNASPECLPFRDRIIQACWGARTRLGLMPGATPEILKLASGNLDKLVTDCEQLEHALARGRELEFLSYTESGEEHSLRMGLGGWDRLPVASDGLIGDGAWGNVPSGETYIAPVEYSAAGSIVINGSLPGKVIGSGEEIILHFVRGKLEKFEPASSPAARWLEDTQFQTAIRRNDENWSCLAEIGIGVNPGVDRLTGNMLFDEKMAGTAHIALGSNRYMGGEIDATIHCDLVVQGPTIRIDGHEMLHRGRFIYEKSVWQENYAQVSLNGNSPSSSMEWALSGIQGRRLPDGRLKRVLKPGTGRVSSCFVGDDQTASLAGRLYSILPQDGSWDSVQSLSRQSSLDVETARRVLHVMWLYDLVLVR